METLRIPHKARFNRATVQGASVEGTCLEPWFSAGDTIYFDPTLEARDGDFVVADMCMAGPMVCGTRSYRRVPGVKLLRIAADGSQWLVANDSTLKLEDESMTRVIGPVVAWKRPGWWKRPAVRHARHKLKIEDHLMR